MGHENGQSGESTGNSHNELALRMVQRKVTVRGSGGVTATVVVTVRRGKVWGVDSAAVYVGGDYGAGESRGADADASASREGGEDYG